MSLHEAALKKGNLWLLRRRKRKADPGPFEKIVLLKTLEKGQTAGLPSGSAWYLARIREP
jgi:hypothetical protein